jgi:arylsulfatase A-like enzyme
MRSHRRDDDPITPAQTNEGWTVDHAIRLLDTRDRERPFFLTCSLNGPHPPFKIPQPYYGMYDPATIPKPPNFGPTPGEPAALSRSFYRTVFRDHGETWDAWRKSVAVYWGFVTMVDAQIGRLLERMEQEKLLDQTLVILTTDHGEMLGQHGLWQKYHAYEEALRVPLIMRAPWLIRPGVRSRAAASLIDVAPTVFAACGLPADPAAQGMDLSFAFAGTEPAERRRFLFSEFKPKAAWHGVVDWRLITDNRYKYVWNRDDIDELYDLSTDPYELVNLVASPEKRALVGELRAELVQWMRRTHDPLVPHFERQQQRTSASRADRPAPAPRMTRSGTDTP